MNKLKYCAYAKIRTIAFLRILILLMPDEILLEEGELEKRVKSTGNARYTCGLPSGSKAFSEEKYAKQMRSGERNETA
jgi:hypothetical protein